jgi:hypothetical protein
MEAGLDDPGRKMELAAPQLRLTFGEKLAGGAIVDAVAPKDGAPLELIHWTGSEKFRVAPLIETGALICQTPDVHPSIREAVIFPRGVEDYGSVASLFGKIWSLLRESGGLRRDLAAFVTCWTLATWVPELLLIPLILCVGGAPMHEVHKLFRLLRVVCRRGLLVAKLSRNLPFALSPTLIVNDPQISAKDRAFWRAANCPGTFVAGTADTVCQLSCSKIILVRPEDSPEAWGQEALHLMLPQSELPGLSDQALVAIANELQPQLEMFRLRLLSEMDQFSSPSHPLAKFALARNLGACVPEDPEIVAMLTPLFESHQEGIATQRSCDPRVAILEAIWTPSHQQDEMSVAEIAKRVNAILHSRGLNHEYSVKEIGWKLRNLGLSTSRTGKGKELRFAESRGEIHYAAREFRMQLSFVKNCTDCQEIQAAEGKGVM